MFLSLCSTLKSVSSNPEFLCLPYLNCVGHFRLNPVVAIIFGCIVVWMKSIWLLDKEDDTKGNQVCG